MIFFFFFFLLIYNMVQKADTVEQKKKILPYTSHYSIVYLFLQPFVNLKHAASFILFTFWWGSLLLLLLFYVMWYVPFSFYISNLYRSNFGS